MPVSPKTAAGMELLRSGKAKTFASAASAVGVHPSTLAERWRQDERGRPLPGAAEDEEKTILERAEEALEEGVDDDDELDLTETEERLAQRVIDIGAQRDRKTTELRGARITIRERDAEIEALKARAQILEEVENVERPDWMVTADEAKDHHGTIVAPFSDFHVGEVVDPEEMNGYNAYNPDIAAQRIERFFQKIVELTRAYLQGVTYDGIVVPNLGDTISGNIHEELNETNGLSNAEAVPFVVPLLEEGIGILADEFGKVHVPCCPGNHPRDQKKPRYKGRSAHNADTMISKLVANSFRNDDRVTFDIPAAFSCDFEVYDTAIRIEHGDEARGGTGIQGALAPLALRAHRARKQAEAEGVPFDLLMVGHWHQLMSLPAKGLFVNGAGKGYDEYARGKAFEPEPPQQGLLVVTPEYGVGLQMPIFVGDREAEGW